jgi:hypothetical protein
MLACPNQNNPLELEACPSASRTRPQTFNTTTSQQDETYTTDASHGLDHSPDHCVGCHRLTWLKLFRPTPAHRRDSTSTRHWPYVSRSQHASDLSHTLEIITAESAHRKRAVRIFGSHGANTGELCSSKRTTKHGRQKQTQRCWQESHKSASKE